MHFIQELFETSLKNIALIVSFIGVLIILVGSVLGFYSYITRKDFHHTRRILNQHLILGLDFLIGVDIIDTLLLSEDDNLLNGLAGLIVVVGLRIVLTYFTSKELKELDGLNKTQDHYSSPNKTLNLNKTVVLKEQHHHHHHK